MFALTKEQIDEPAVVRSVESSGAGAIVVFAGRVRDKNEGRTVNRLEYEAFEPLCLHEGMRIIAEAEGMFEITAARCLHRTGGLSVGETAVLVAVAAGHRGPAFQACSYIIDQVKARLPIWKKEHYQDGTSGWVNCQSHTGAHCHK